MFPPPAKKLTLGEAVFRLCEKIGKKKASVKKFLHISIHKNLSSRSRALSPRTYLHTYQRRSFAARLRTRNPRESAMQRNSNTRTHREWDTICICTGLYQAFVEMKCLVCESRFMMSTHVQSANFSLHTAHRMDY